ncbi:MAG TPA: hypothetical protein ENJ65_02625 [Candidatus Tenderia electrophaga]|uniref:Protochlamydia outer membrane protein domain-containing protein n=1 Tax=Candidatus Tenderia electrophaga TaxID=1748243 RepID=A0A832J812_9GAMM|nr:hypothetical protein [Candidatus Tenderia electrophaga]
MSKSVLGIVLGCCAAGMAAAESGLSTTLQLGYRVDNLDWNIAGNLSGQQPNVLSELRWSDLQAPQLKLAVSAHLAGFEVRGRLAYGVIVKGDNQDSDYASDDRGGEFSRTNNAGGGELADASLGLGRKFYTSNGKGKLSSYFMPMLGYAIHIQDLQLSDAFQTIPATGAFSGLNSRYDAEWQGGWVGLVMGEANMETGFEVELSLIYQRVDFQAEADWNLRDDFAHPKSFEQLARGDGFSLSLNGRVPVADAKNQFWIFGFDYGRWQTSAGLDTTYFADGSNDTTRLNRVRWQSSAINLGLEWRM